MLTLDDLTAKSLVPRVEGEQEVLRTQCWVRGEGLNRETSVWARLASPPPLVCLNLQRAVEAGLERTLELSQRKREKMKEEKTKLTRRWKLSSSRTKRR